MLFRPGERAHYCIILYYILYVLREWRHGQRLWQITITNFMQKPRASIKHNFLHVLVCSYALRFICLTRLVFVYCHRFVIVSVWHRVGWHSRNRWLVGCVGGYQTHRRRVSAKKHYRMLYTRTVVGAKQIQFKL